MAETSLPMDSGLYTRDTWPCGDDAATVYYTGMTIDSTSFCDIHSVSPETIVGVSVELSCVDHDKPETRFTTFAHIKVINRKNFEWNLAGDIWRFRWCSAD